MEKDNWATGIGRDEMLKPIDITLTECEEDTDTADGFEDAIVIHVQHSYGIKLFE